LPNLPGASYWQSLLSGAGNWRQNHRCLLL
jgi:hypothetical protein